MTWMIWAYPHDLGNPHVEIWNTHPSFVDHLPRKTMDFPKIVSQISQYPMISSHIFPGFTTCSPFVPFKIPALSHLSISHYSCLKFRCPNPGWGVKITSQLRDGTPSDSEPSSMVYGRYNELVNVAKTIRTIPNLTIFLVVCLPFPVMGGLLLV